MTGVVHQREIRSAYHRSTCIHVYVSRWISWFPVTCMLHDILVPAAVSDLSDDCVGAVYVSQYLYCFVITKLVIYWHLPRLVFYKWQSNASQRVHSSQSLSAQCGWRGRPQLADDHDSEHRLRCASSQWSPCLYTINTMKYNKHIYYNIIHSLHTDWWLIPMRTKAWPSDLEMSSVLLLVSVISSRHSTQHSDEKLSLYTHTTVYNNLL